MIIKFLDYDWSMGLSFALTAFDIIPDYDLTDRLFEYIIIYVLNNPYKKGSYFQKGGYPERATSFFCRGLPDLTIFFRLII